MLAGQNVTCPICGTETYRCPSIVGRKCCSKKCANQLISERYRNDPDRILQLRRASLMRDHTRPYIREMRSRIVKECFADGRIKKRTGADSPFWKGGVATLQNRLRQTPEYKAWRKAVYERDGYSCVKCGTNKELHAHHIKTFAKFPDLRYDVDNGMTVCRTHHGEIHGRVLPNIGIVRHNERKLKLLNE